MKYVITLIAVFFLIGFNYAKEVPFKIVKYEPNNEIDLLNLDPMEITRSAVRDDFSNSIMVDTVINMSVSSSSLSFGNANVGQTITRTFIVTNLNTSNAYLHIAPGSLTTPFSVSPSAAVSLPPGTSRTYTVTFRPTSIGAFNQTLDITNNSSNLSRPFPIAMSGTGINSSIIMGANATFLNFGNVVVGQAQTRTVNITNSSSSSGPLVITPGSLPSAFSFTPTGTTSIPVGGNRTFTITFRPTSAFSFNNVNWNFNNNSTNMANPYNISLNANGVNPNIIMTVNRFVVDFGSINFFQSPTSTVTVSNASTSTGPLVISPGSTNSAFSISPTTSTTLAPGASMTYTITFRPTTTEVLNSFSNPTYDQINFNSQWNISNNSTNNANPYSITLKGTGR